MKIPKPKKKTISKTQKCQYCGKEFAVPKWRLGIAKYCSYDCSNKGRTTARAYSKPRICVSCGVEFYPTQWDQKYCSRKCFTSAVKIRKEVTCRNCGKEFMQARTGQKYCSRKCSNPYKDRALKKPKQEGLDDLWSKAVKALAGNKCEYCGKVTGLNSHHVFSRSNNRVRWDTDNGVCVCVLHHVFGLFSAHKSPIEFVEWIKEARGVGWYEKLRAKASLARPYKKLNKEEAATLRKELREKALIKEMEIIDG